MAKKTKQTRTEQKVRGKITKAAAYGIPVFLIIHRKPASTKQGGSNKKLVKKHQDYLRGLEKRKQEYCFW